MPLARSRPRDAVLAYVRPRNPAQEIRTEQGSREASPEQQRTLIVTDWGSPNLFSSFIRNATEKDTSSPRSQRPLTCHT